MEIICDCGKHIDTLDKYSDTKTRVAKCDECGDVYLITKIKEGGKNGKKV